MRRLICILSGIAGGFLVALAAFRPLLWMFLRRYPDCGLQQSDRQCGMAMAMDTMYAGGVAFLLWLVVAVFVMRILLRRFGQST